MKKYLLIATLFLLGFSAKSQDIHFSQYYASPLTLNPAMTGLFNGEFRVAANVRGQWFLIPNTGAAAPYSTYQVSYEHSLFRKKLRNSNLGVGLMAYADEAGNGSLTTQAIMASAAYHLALDRFGRHRIGLGFQGGVVFKRVFQHDLLFETQWDAGLNSFNNLLDNQEGSNFEGSIMYPDFNAGVIYSSQLSKKVGYYLGFALNHIATPNESFLGDKFNKIDRRFIVHGGASWKAGKYFKILPTVLYMMQSQAQQLNAGSAFEYEFSDEFSAFVGGFARVVGDTKKTMVADAAIITLGAEFFNVRVGASYDFNVSQLSAATKSVGAAEISIIYIHNKQEPGDIDYSKFCPNF